MTDHLHDAVSGVLLPGGELRDWSDSDLVDQDANALHAIVADIAQRTSPSSALLLGPRAVSLAATLPAGIRITAATRALDDARTGAASRTDITWIAAPADRLSLPDHFDLVVALGGPEQLLSPDSVPWGRVDMMQALATWAGATGIIVADLANDVGADRMFAAAGDGHLPDGAFLAGAGGGDHRGAWHHEVAGVLDAAGLVSLRTYAQWPDGQRPAVLFTREAEDSTRSAGLIDWALHHVVERPVGARTPIEDPVRTTRDLIRARLGFTLAPRWLVVAGAASWKESALAGPSVVISETWPLSGPRRTITVTGDTDSVELDVELGPDAPPGRGWKRSPEAPQAGPRLDTAVSEALRRGDRNAARTMLTAYADWLFGLDQQDPSRGAAVASNTTVGDGDTTPRLIDGSVLAGPVAATIVLDTSLSDLARRIIGSGQRHPFPPSATEAELAAELFILANREHDQRVHGSDEARRHQSALTNAGLLIETSTPPAPEGRRELVELVQRLRDEAVESRAKANWLEGMLRRRTREVTVLERTVSVESSRAYAVLRQAARPVPAIRRRAGLLVKKLRSGTGGSTRGD